MGGMQLHSRLLILTLTVAPLALGAPVSPSPQEAPKVGPNRSDEPLIDHFSLAGAVSFIDGTALGWERQRNCVTCHTNGLYLVARGQVSTEGADYRRAREFARTYLNRYVVEKQAASGQRGAVEGLVATTCFLTISDMKTNGRLSPDTRKALDHVWSLQDEDGAWGKWLKCGWPPFESDDHFGVTLAAVAVGVLPESYRRSEPATLGLQRLRRWLGKNPPQNLHHKGMMLWAATNLDGLFDATTKGIWSSELLAAQRKDGGWRLVDLGAGHWKRPEDIAETLPSDAYATAFSIFSLRKAGVPADHPQLVGGLKWLRESQRESGRWFVRSPKRDGKHYISHAATQFAVMAFSSCGESP
ncbi:MAG TPA: squalene--hopene cyclase [Planctomycetes bacterium]|nr:squalene--hopene cyclase [Planctomycetota bacterium]HIN79813.1 squalene--hopene cyclase [Planctomycetota bacterium]